MSGTLPYPPDPMSQAPVPQYPASHPKGGFIPALFDLSFTRFVTIRFAQVIYVLAIAVVTLVWLGVIVSGFMDSATRGILMLMFGWIPALFWLLLLRLWIERSVAIVRTAINTGEMAK